MGLFKKASAGVFLAKYFNQRRGHRYRGRAYRQRAPGGFFVSPIGRISLGSLVFFVARRFLGRQRYA
jgi:hypothetical protein